MEPGVKTEKLVLVVGGTRVGLKHRLDPYGQPLTAWATPVEAGFVPCSPSRAVPWFPTRRSSDLVCVVGSAVRVNSRFFTTSVTVVAFVVPPPVAVMVRG